MLPKLAVVGGCGHVGLPLAIGLAEAGYSTAIFDTDAAACRIVQSGRLPFQEAEAQAVLPRVIGDKRLTVGTDPRALSSADVVFCAIGTPVDEYLNPTTHRFIATLHSLRPHLRDGQVLALRSTMFPGTSQLVQRLFEEKGPKIDVACCPERVAQGKGYVELRQLPQVVSAFSERAAAALRAIFQKLGAAVIELSPAEAELVKLFNNAWRYFTFAVANQFFEIANDYGVDYYRIHNALTEGYPRGAGLPTAGFAAGPCLFKDTMQLVAFSNNRLALGHAAMFVNEGLPLYVVERLARRFDLSKMTVGILGLTFKADCDDLRDSLAFKLRKILLPRAKRILCSDAKVGPEQIARTTTQIWPEDLVSAERLIDESDIVILGAPHGDYRSLDYKDKVVVDIWNLRGQGALV